MSNLNLNITYHYLFFFEKILEFLFFFPLRDNVSAIKIPLIARSVFIVTIKTFASLEIIMSIYTAFR